MDHLLHYIKKEVSYTSDSGVIYLDLPKDADISMLMLEVDMTVKGGSHDNTNSILHCVEKIHVLLDGAKVAYTMQPEVGSYDYWLRRGSHPPHELASRPTADDIMRLPIMFGRYPGDLEYGLDTGLYGSAAVEIEYTLDTSDYDTTTTDLTAWILVPVEPVTYNGFIRARIIEDKAAPTASSVHTVDFPSTYPLLAAFFRIQDSNEYPYNNVTDLDFQADQGRYRIFNGRFEDLLMINDIILGYNVEGPTVRHHVADTNNPIAFMGMMRGWRIESFSGYANNITSTSWKGNQYDVSVAATVSGFFTGIGRLPYCCVLLGDWRDKPFDAPAHADLKCDYTISTSPDYLTTCVLEVVTGVL